MSNRLLLLYLPAFSFIVQAQAPKSEANLQVLKSQMSTLTAIKVLEPGPKPKNVSNENANLADFDTPEYSVCFISIGAVAALSTMFAKSFTWTRIGSGSECYA